jgi:anti-sigma B factor antagonist
VQLTCNFYNTDAPITTLSAQDRKMIHSSKTSNNVLVLALTMDSLDASNVRKLKEAIAELIGTSNRVVLDLSGLKFVDSSGLGVMLSCLRNVRERHGDLRLCAMTPTVRSLFELMRMHRVFNIYETREEAVHAFD